MAVRTAAAVSFCVAMSHSRQPAEHVGIRGIYVYFPTMVVSANTAAGGWVFWLIAQVMLRLGTRGSNDAEVCMHIPCPG